MIKISEFETSVCGCPIYSMNIPKGSLFKKDELSKHLDSCHNHIIAKVDSEENENINWLLSMGFRYSCFSIRLHASLNGFNEIEETEKNILQIQPDDIVNLFPISDAAFFANNRYANDPFLGKFCRDIHRRWLSNSITGYADYNCSMKINGKFAGYATLHMRDGYSSIGLLAVSTDFRRMKIATNLILHLCKHTKASGRQYIVVATEGSNCPAINTYFKNCFTVNGSDISLFRESL